MCFATVILPATLIIASALGEEAATEEQAAQEEPATQPARTWTSRSGATIEARFDKWERGAAVLVKPDGKSVRIRPSALIPEDEIWLKKNAPPPAASTTPKAGSSAPKADDSPLIINDAGTNVLPHYGSGTWSNMNAVYEHPNFEAALDKNGRLWIFPKIDGERVGKPMTMSAGGHYWDKKKHKSIGRGVVEYRSPPAPTMRARAIVLDARHDDRVVIQTHFEFKDNTIAFGGHCIDPRKIKYPTTFGLSLSVPQSITIPEGQTRAERKIFLEPYNLRIRRVSGEKDIVPFWKSLQNLGGPARDVKILGPLYDERQVSVRAKSVKRAPLGPWIYPGSFLWMGFSVELRKEAKDSKSKSQRMVLKIE